MLFTTIKLSSKYNKGLHAKLQIQRRKIAILKLFQANLHSPLFLEKKIDKFIYLFAFNTSELMKIIFINWMFHFFLNRKPHIPSCILDLSFTRQNFPYKIFDFPPNLKNSLCYFSSLSHR